MQLLFGNLRDAHSLGLIECSRTEIDAHTSDVEHRWDSTAPSPAQRHLHSLEVGNTRRIFDRRFRPIQAFRGRTIPFCNVMTFADYVKYWSANTDPSASGIREAEAAWRYIRLQNASLLPATAAELAQLADEFLRLSHWAANAGSGRGSSGLSIPIGALVNTAVRSFWVGGRVNKPMSLAQFWRDRLGLIHIDAGKRHASDLLVRLRFVAGFVDQELDRGNHIGHRNTNPTQVWLFRPSVLHGNNRRFVQGVHADRAGRPARRGSTRDLASPNYEEGERELLLLAGELARVRLVGIDLLDGFAQTNTSIDENDDAFVRFIADHCNWTVVP